MSFLFALIGLLRGIVFGQIEVLFIVGPTGLLRGAVFGDIKGRIFDFVAEGGCVLAGLGFGIGNLIGNGVLEIFALIRYFWRARATVTCSCSSLFTFCNNELSDCCATEQTERRCQIHVIAASVIFKINSRHPS